MGLPPIGEGWAKVTLPGGLDVEVRGLTRREVLATAEDELTERPELEGLSRPEAYEVYVMAAGTDTPIPATRAWYERAPSSYVDPIVSKISELSGLGEQGKSSGEDS